MSSHFVLLLCCVLVCLNVCSAFPMWYGHPLFMGTYRPYGKWWPGNAAQQDDSFFSGYWGSKLDAGDN